MTLPMNWLVANQCVYVDHLVPADLNSVWFFLKRSMWLVEYIMQMFIERQQKELSTPKLLTKHHKFICYNATTDTVLRSISNAKRHRQW